MEKSEIDLEKHATRGVWPISLGMCLAHTLSTHLNKLTFACFQGYLDIAHLIKIMNQNQLLPNIMRGFFQCVGMFFGVKILYLKVLVKHCDVPQNIERKSLGRICKAFGVERVCGSNHQAGSDALLTLKLVWRLKRESSQELFSQHEGILWRLESYSSPDTQDAGSSWAPVNSSQALILKMPDLLGHL